MRIFRRCVCVLAGVRTPLPRAAKVASLNALQVSSQPYFTSTGFCRAGAEGGAAAAVTTAAAGADVKANGPGKFDDVGRRLYSLQRYHIDSLRTHGTDDTARLRIVRDAWNILQSIPDQEADRLPTRDLAEIVQCYNYFSKFWENGMEGPAKATASGADGTVSALNNTAEDASSSAAFDYPFAERSDIDAPTTLGDCTTTQLDVETRDYMAPPRRANPLDEILDF
ncbi:hypothetical protein ABL78_0688 [Leptomonas seymouri]|uniref:RNA-editing substrate-binding complex 7 protein domain-containing protein n=1 Tax=Leptomonas seymouri TaxID=5684 RepID=A0A0N1PED9_LEPSE|nr:hypothetical protein ABL78_0688 [Leptomonas seymouri]|eukprot:KPI90170.1 hypothetical protein ABL78_0688 [Leptomonas seymouri]